MCGIFGYVGKSDSAAKIVFNGIKNLEYRGYDSWGLAVLTGDGKIAVKKKAGKIGSSHINDLQDGNLAIGHTRWATHGNVTDINAHPHLDCSGNIALIHNGIFENYSELKKSLIKRNHKFISETDSETIAHLIEDLQNINSFTEAVRKTFNKMMGLNAIIAFQNDKKKIVAVRNGSPLVLGIGKDENFIASDAAALIPYTREVYFLDDNELAIIEDKQVEVFNSKTGKKIKYITQKLDWVITEGEKGKFKDFMLKEIYEQPDRLSEIALNQGLQAEKIAEKIGKYINTYLVGCGTASYACLAGSYLLSKIAGKHVNWAIGSEFGYQLDFLDKRSLVIALSQSGETMDILESVKKAKDKNAKILSLVNVFGSSLYRLSDYKMLIGVGPEKAVASTKAFTGMLAHLILVSYALAHKPEEGREVLMKAVKSLNNVLSKNTLEKIKKLSKLISDKKHIYVIGRGLSYATAVETALKIKEISYIHAEGLAAGELKHGPLALVEKGTPCIVFLPDDETYGANLAGAMEMRARGGFVIGISHKNHEVFDYFVKIEDAKEATIIPHVGFAQLLAYYITKNKGLDADKPRNLAKSVTVK